MKQIIWIFFLIATISGCATTHIPTPSTEPIPAKPQQPWATREQTLSRIQSWQLNGKIAVQTARDSGSATVDWIQRARQYTIGLVGPLGSNSLKLSGQPGRVTLVTADGKRVTANNPEQLLAKQWGFHVPVSYMNYWVRGLPVANVPSNTKFDADNRISELSQQGWHVQYLGYTKKDGMDLPSKMSISSAELKVKIAIYDWKLE